MELLPGFVIAATIHASCSGFVYEELIKKIDGEFCLPLRRRRLLAALLCVPLAPLPYLLISMLYAFIQLIGLFTYDAYKSVVKVFRNLKEAVK